MATKKSSKKSVSKKTSNHKVKKTSSRARQTKNSHIKKKSTKQHSASGNHRKESLFQSSQKQSQNNNSTRRILKKTWNFLWHDDSIASWIANIVLAFVLIKFVVYPILSLLFGTSLPLVAVVSCSMEHDFTNCDQPIPVETLCASTGEGNRLSDQEYWSHCGDFYEDINISYERFETFPFDDGFNKGDVIFLKGEQPSNIEIGDVLVFKAEDPNSYPIIHRVVKKHQLDNGEFVFETKGDHNAAQIRSNSINEYNITEEDIIGIGTVRVPFVGYLKIWFVDLLSFIGVV